MDPNQQDQTQGNGTDGSPKVEKDAQAAADLIRQQIQAIYAGQVPANTSVQSTDTTTGQSQQSAQITAPKQAPAANRHQSQTPVQSQPVVSLTMPERPSRSQATTPNTLQQPAHYNPYQKATNPIVAANSPDITSDASGSQLPTSPPTTASLPKPPQQPGGASYRANYSTFVLPGETQPKPPLNTSQQTQPDPRVTLAPGLAPDGPPSETVQKTEPLSVADLKQRVAKRVQNVDKKTIHNHLKPLLISLLAGLLFIGVNYNEVAIAQVKQYISPGDSISTPVILDPSANVKVGSKPKLIIPKINLDVPVIYDIKGYDEAQIQDGLERGVVHYGNTAYPGEKGNVVIVGHSSNNYFNSGEYKFAFVLLFRLEKGDTFILHYGSKRYIYKVYNKQVINPDNFSLIQPTNKPIVTLITCTPPGTSWRRLVIQANQISPNPDDAAKSNAKPLPNDINTPVPGNAPSLWQRITNAIF